MEVFSEKQFVKWWWLVMFILAIILIVVGSAYYGSRNAEEDTSVLISLISLLIAAPIVFALIYLRLETRIDKNGISTYFRPFRFTKKSFSWREIKECYVRQYSPKREYGGWGLRGLGGKSKAYNIWGNRGIQIITKEGEEFLIGTQDPEAAQEVINKYKKTNEI